MNILSQSSSSPELWLYVYLRNECDAFTWCGCSKAFFYILNHSGKTLFLQVCFIYKSLLLLLSVITLMWSLTWICLYLYICSLIFNWVLISYTGLLSISYLVTHHVLLFIRHLAAACLFCSQARNVQWRQHDVSFILPILWTTANSTTLSNKQDCAGIIMNKGRLSLYGVSFCFFVQPKKPTAVNNKHHRTLSSCFYSWCCCCVHSPTWSTLKFFIFLFTESLANSGYIVFIFRNHNNTS